MSSPGSWGRSWLTSWMGSWGRSEEDTGRSGWFRLWLAKAQQASLDERDKILNAKKPETKQGAEVVPKIVARAAKKTRKVEKLRPVVQPVVQENRAPVIQPAPAVPRLLDQPLPDYSVSVFQKARDFQHHQQHLKQKRQREEETLILLLAA